VVGGLPAKVLLHQAASGVMGSGGYHHLKTNLVHGLTARTAYQRAAGSQQLYRL
jgi:hypothetical protein